MAERKPHPIVTEITSLMVPGEKEAWILEESSILALEQGLRELKKADRPQAVKDLVRMAYVLDQKQGLTQAPSAILDVVERVAKSLRGRVKSTADVAGQSNSEAGQRFADFAANRPKTAPKLGAQAPEGSRPVGSFGFFARRA